MPAKRVLITGIAGFAGSHLAELCVASGDEVAGTILPRSETSNIDTIRRDLNLISADLLKPEHVHRALQRSRPHWIFHLAASTSVGESFEDPAGTIRNNVNTTLNLLEAIRQDAAVRKSIQKILIVASSEVYGRVKPSQIPLTEATPLQPVNPYGASKAAVEMIAMTYRESFGLPIVHVRASNHTGPRQRTGFVVPDFCYSIAQLERKTGKRIIKVGNLSAKRDFSDVRDIVQGYRLIAERGKEGVVYHLGSGKARTVKSVLDALLRLAEVSISVVTDPAKMRPAEVPVLRPDISRAQRDVGFRPKIPWSQTLRDTLEYYRHSIL
ncbi:MAG: GDP-mannose 4,6-dehydratase [Candidatus Zixiibacteriota bacterium]